MNDNDNERGENVLMWMAIGFIGVACTLLLIRGLV